MSRVLKNLSYYWISILIFIFSIFATGSEADKLYFMALCFLIVGLVEQTSDDILDAIKNINKGE